MFELPENIVAKSETLQHLIAKLHRANQHIDQLELEVNAFLNETPYRDLVDYDPETAEAFKDIHANRVVNPRLSVLTGDVLYQLRSTLDHIACAAIVKSGNQPTLQSQFPIFSHKPTEPKDIARYEAQVKGITDQDVLGVIQAFQPYSRGNHQIIEGCAKRFAILKSLSNFDKHRALILHVVNVAHMRRQTFPTDSGGPTVIIDGPDDGTEFIPGVPVSNQQRRLSAYVAFNKFGDSAVPIPIVDGLRSLRSAIDPLLHEIWGAIA